MYSNMKFLHMTNISPPLYPWVIEVTNDEVWRRPWLFSHRLHFQCYSWSTHLAHPVASSFSPVYNLPAFSTPAYPSRPGASTQVELSISKDAPPAPLHPHAGLCLGQRPHVLWRGSSNVHLLWRDPCYKATQAEPLRWREQPHLRRLPPGLPQRWRMGGGWEVQGQAKRTPSLRRFQRHPNLRRWDPAILW